MAEFTPTYLEIDFLTLVDKFREELKDSDIYRDYDFEGSNISIMIELMSYIGELTTFFTNKIAKNVYLETADVYEAANRLARQVGYEPKGIRAARATLTVTVSGTSPGDVIKVLPWKQLNSGRADSEGTSIFFATTSESPIVTASGTSVTFPLLVRQGQIIDLENYSGDDLIDNELILPEDYAYDDDLTDVYPSLRVLVNDVQWERLSDFYLDLIPQSSDDVYMFIYDRYRRSKIVFNEARNVPAKNDRIDVRVLDSLGPDGAIAADAGEQWTIVDSEFLELASPPGYIFNPVANDSITISLSASSVGASDPETITEIQFNSQSALRAQFRDVTPNDYNSYLSSRSDVIRANAWGEQDMSPSAGDPQEYNIVHLSVIPQVWGNSTIPVSAGSFTTDWGVSASTMLALGYKASWEDELLNYLAPRKMISAYEIFEVPDLVYFTFEIGVRKKRIYTFSDVAEDVLQKLIYYFRPQNQLFNSEMDFKDVVEFLLDTTQVSPDNEFPNIKGIRNLNIRDINVWTSFTNSKTVYAHNAHYSLYPRWVDKPWTNRDNMLNQVQLGLNQFPILAYDAVKIIEEY